MSSNNDPDGQTPIEKAVQQAGTATGGTGIGTGDSGSEHKFGATLFGVLVYLAVGLFVAWRFPTGRELITRWWWVLAVGIALVLGVLFVRPIRERFASTTAKGRMGIFVFGVIPGVLLSFGMVVLLPERFQVAALRIIFLVPVCFLPAIMYYLFMATKKNSLFNEFIMNLDGLGLLELRPKEAEGERKNRVLAYQQRFEAVYGAVPTDLADLVLVPVAEGRIASERHPSGTGSGTIAGIFTAETAVPVVLSTVLIALGWLITLPPWYEADAERGQAEPAQRTEQTRERRRVEQKPEALLASLILRDVPAQLALLQGEGQDEQSQPAAQSEQQESDQQAKSRTAEQVAAARSQKWLAAFTPEATPVHFAFLGAYFFCLQMLFRRYVRRDLRASAYVAVALRIILAVIGTWVVVKAVATVPQQPVETQSLQSYNNGLLVLGFVIGVFPRVAWQVIQVTTKRIFAIAVPNLQTQLPINDLDGLTVWHEARLEEEDIENIPNMATADIVDLMLNTRIPSDRIIDWVDQAILFTHIGPETEGRLDSRGILRGHGIRTASSLVEAYNRSESHGDRDKFEKILPSAEEARSPMRSLVDALGTNPNLELIQTWRMLEPHHHTQSPA